MPVYRCSAVGLRPDVFAYSTLLSRLQLEGREHSEVRAAAFTLTHPHRIPHPQASPSHTWQVTALLERMASDGVHPDAQIERALRRGSTELCKMR